MPRKVLILRGADEAIAAKARRRGLEVLTCAPSEAEFERALVVAPKTRVPWDLLENGFHFVTLWDAATPLWRYNVTAETIGTPEERKITEALTLDLRIPIYACELLFVQASEWGRGLLEAWEEECASLEAGGPRDERLAFLRAVARVKPRLCMLPADWLGAIRKTRPVGTRRARAPRSTKEAPLGLVRVEVGPGRFVLARPSQVEKVQERYRKRRRGV